MRDWGEGWSPFHLGGSLYPSHEGHLATFPETSRLIIKENANRLRVSRSRSEARASPWRSKDYLSGLYRFGFGRRASGPKGRVMPTSPCGGTVCRRGGSVAGHVPTLGFLTRRQQERDGDASRSPDGIHGCSGHQPSKTAALSRQGFLWTQGKAAAPGRLGSFGRSPAPVAGSKRASPCQPQVTPTDQLSRATFVACKAIGALARKQ